MNVQACDSMRQLQNGEDRNFVRIITKRYQSYSYIVGLLVSYFLLYSTSIYFLLYNTYLIIPEIFTKYCIILIIRKIILVTF